MHGDVDVLNALLVANEDGSATVSAAFVNKTGDEQCLSNVTVTTLDGAELPVRGLSCCCRFPPTSSQLSARSLRRRRLHGHRGCRSRATTSRSPSASPTRPRVTIEVPVVTRTADYDKVTGGTPGGETEADATEETEEAAH